MSAALHICWSRAIYAWRAIRYCPVCKRKRRFVVRDCGWYGLEQSCCGCGDTWQDGEMCGRPFRRGWRQERTKRLRAEWQGLTARDVDEWNKRAAKYWEPYTPKPAGDR